MVAYENMLKEEFVSEVTFLKTFTSSQQNTAQGSTWLWCRNKGGNNRVGA